MENHQDRRRSPSVSRQAANNHQSPPFDHSSPPNTNLDPSSAFNPNAPQFFSNNFLETSTQNPFQQSSSQDYNTHAQEQAFKQGSSISNEQRPQFLDLQDSNHQFGHDPSGGQQAFMDFHGQDMSTKQEQQMNNMFMLDPALQAMSQNQSVNPADLMGGNLSPQSGMPRQSANSLHLAPNQSPPMQQDGFYTASRSRQASLTPASATFGHGNVPDWSGMVGPNFQQHRRTPSEYSDISGNSPLLPHQESFDAFESHSPSLNPQQDPSLYHDAQLNIERFTISDPQQLQHSQSRSPGHSPFVSPRMSPHPGLGIGQDPTFVLPSNDSDQFGESRPQIYTTQSGYEMGQAAQMAPPEINVELAPPSRQNTGDPGRENDLDALSPPEGGRRGRMRAKSDPYSPMSRPITPAELSVHPSSLEAAQRRRSLSPFDGGFPGNVQNIHRDLSPGLGSGSNSKSSRRSSTSSIPNRDFILSIADPNRPSAGPGASQRVQKHPATFQCHLCPKRFTRAYNLRSHLRTHTDERPFVCTVCGKAFARQHDRKRHEGLHSGEKKFVCRGELPAVGGHWGCGRRFARADALGRHFRSEAGRVCIKPLLDEEAAERQRLFEEQMMHQQQQGMQGGLMPVQQPRVMDGGNFVLPAALLAQYPALQGLQWDQLGVGGPDEGEGGISGRSSFDGGSGGEYFDDDIDEGGYVSGPGGGPGQSGPYGGGGWGQGGGQGGNDWTSDYER